MHQLRRQLLQLRAGAGGFVQTPFELFFEAQCNGDSGQGEESTAAEGDTEGGNQRPSEALRRACESFLGARQAALIDGLDSIGNLQHGGAARHQLLVEKRIAQPVALFRSPVEGGLKDLPVSVYFTAQSLKCVALAWIDGAGVMVEERQRFTLDPVQASTLRSGSAGIRREEIIANVGSGQIDLRADPFQRAEPFNERPPHLGVFIAHAVESHERSGGRGEKERQQTAETCEKYGLRTKFAVHLYGTSVWNGMVQQNTVPTGWFRAAAKARIAVGDLIPLKKSLLANAVAIAALSLFGSACAKKQVAVKTAPPPVQIQAPAPAAAVVQPAPTPAPRQTQPVAQNTPSRMPDAVTRARIDELLGRIQDAYFDYNRHTLRDDAVKTLNADSKELAQIMSQYPDYKLKVEGYCDERGSAEYNLALGEARAKAAKEYLVSVGVSADQLSTVSYGKEKQVCEEHDEACWAKNRRVHIVALAMN
jgi:peptidoglycan-associated lipoprotein